MMHFKKHIPGPTDAQAPRRAQAGFTLIEVLAALLVLAILGFVVTTAMLTGTRVMEQTQTASNAAVLEQSIETALSDVLRYASVHAPYGAGDVSDPSFDSDSYFDSSGAAVRSGQIGISDGKIALISPGGVQFIPKSSGIYTDFEISDFNLEYSCDTNVFTAHYSIVMPNGTYSRACEFVCKTLSDESFE